MRKKLIMLMVLVSAFIIGCGTENNNVTVSELTGNAKLNDQTDIEIGQDIDWGAELLVDNASDITVDIGASQKVYATENSDFFIDTTDSNETIVQVKNGAVLTGYINQITTPNVNVDSANAVVKTEILFNSTKITVVEGSVDYNSVSKVESTNGVLNEGESLIFDGFDSVENLEAYAISTPEVMLDSKYYGVYENEEATVVVAPGVPRYQKDGDNLIESAANTEYWIVCCKKSGSDALVFPSDKIKTIKPEYIMDEYINSLGQSCFKSYLFEDDYLLYSVLITSEAIEENLFLDKTDKDPVEMFYQIVGSK